jgi:hypothetical protein
VDLPLGVLRELVDLLLDGASRAVRLAVEGRSTARGITPWWLGESSELRPERRHGSDRSAGRDGFRFADERDR